MFINFGFSACLLYFFIKIYCRGLSGEVLVSKNAFSEPFWWFWPIFGVLGPSRTRLRSLFGVLLYLLAVVRKKAIFCVGALKTGDFL